MSAVEGDGREERRGEEGVMLEGRKRRDRRSKRDQGRGRGSVREDEVVGVRELGGRGGGVSGQV